MYNKLLIKVKKKNSKSDRDYLKHTPKENIGSKKTFI